MKKIILIFALAAAIPVIGMAQASEKVQQAFTQAEIDAIVAQDPNELEFLGYFANRAANMQTMRGDISSMPEISTLNALAKNANVPEINAGNFDIATFNPLAYNLDFDNEVYHYRIGDTDQVVQILSEQRVRFLFDNGH